MNSATGASWRSPLDGGLWGIKILYSHSPNPKDSHEIPVNYRKGGAGSPLEVLWRPAGPPARQVFLVLSPIVWPEEGICRGRAKSVLCGVLCRRGAFFDYSGGMFAACPARGSVLPGLEAEVLQRAWDMSISHGCERRFCPFRGLRKRGPLQWIWLRRPPGRRSGQEEAGVQRDMK